MKVVRSLKAGRDRSGLIEGWGLLEICQIRASPSFSIQSTAYLDTPVSQRLDLLSEGSRSIGQERERRGTIDQESHISY